MTLNIWKCKLLLFVFIRAFPLKVSYGIVIYNMVTYSQMMSIDCISVRLHSDRIICFQSVNTVSWEYAWKTVQMNIRSADKYVSIYNQVFTHTE